MKFLSILIKFHTHFYLFILTNLENIILNFNSTSYLIRFNNYLIVVIEISKYLKCVLKIEIGFLLFKNLKFVIKENFKS